MGKIQEALRKAEEARAKKSDASASGASRDATIPAFGGATSAALAAGQRLSDVDPHLVVLADPKSEMAEQYRTLRENLLALTPAAPPKVIVVTSAARGEGKSVTTMNLACSLAELPGKRVVVVDADMRRPSLHKLLGIDNQRGLADYLSGGTMLEMVLQRSKLANLRAVPAGRVPANPAELLGGRGMDDMLARLVRDYDHVLIDTPPVGETLEASVLAPRADATLIAVRMERTSRDAVRHAVELMRKAGGKHVGTVLTALPA